jgi:zinc transporter ZupT
LNKATLVFIVAVVTATSALVGALLPIILPVDVAAPLIAFVGAVSSAAIVYVSTEDSSQTSTGSTTSNSKAQVILVKSRWLARLTS